MIGGYLCDRLLPSCHVLTLIRVHTHIVHRLHWNDRNSTYTFEVLLIVPFIPEEAAFLTPLSYLWKNFYLPLPFVTSYWKITVISGSVGSIQNIKALFQWRTVYCLVRYTCGIVRCEAFWNTCTRLKLKAKDFKIGCVWIRTGCHHMIKRESTS